MVDQTIPEHRTAEGPADERCHHPLSQRPAPLSPIPMCEKFWTLPVAMATVRHDKPSCEDDRQSEQGPGDQRYQPAAGESRTSREAEGACAQCGDSEQFRGPDCKDERAVLQIACARYREQIGQEPIWVERKGDISNPIHWIAGNPKEYRRKAQPLTYDRKVRVRVLYSTLSSFHKRAAA